MKFKVTEEMYRQLIALGDAPTKKDYEQFAEKNGLEVFSLDGKMTLGFTEDIKNQVPRVLEAGYVRTNIPI